MWQCDLGGGIGIDLGVPDVIDDDDDDAVDNAGWWPRFLRLDALVGGEGEERNAESDADSDGVSGIPPCGV